MKKAISLLVMVTASLTTFGQQMTLEEAVKKQINFDNSEEYYSFDLKSLPNDETLSVAAITKYSNGKSNEGGFVVDLILLLIDNNSQNIVSKYIELEKFTSDAVRLYPITLDMANYTMADGVRAFGVRDRYNGSSKPNPYEAENISLYYIKNKEFQLVLNKLETYQYSGETDTRCAFEGEKINTVLIMQKTKTNGYFDIKAKSVTTVMKSEIAKNTENDCITTEKKLKPKTRLIQFVNGKYQLKK
jgi:hypothetical protein